MNKVTFTDLIKASLTVRVLLAKGAGHKYIKRIPIGMTPTGRTKYRYIYKETHTVGGKHLLDEAHLKVGSKLMLERGDGKQVHAHITAVNGNKVTIEYDDGSRKGETKTLTKQDLLSEFDKTHDIGAKIDTARGQAQKDLDTARRSNNSEKVIARLEARVERLRREIKRDVPSALQKRIIKDHRVNTEKIEKHRERLAKRTTNDIRNPVDIMVNRIDLIKGDGIDEAVTSYNNMLERAAADNQDVLTAIEAYQDLITVRFDDPDTLNKIIQTQADNLKHLTETYKLSPDTTGAATLKQIPIKQRSDFMRDVRARTGDDPRGNNMTLKQMCSSMTSATVITEDMESQRLSSEVAQRARAAIQEHVEKACADFSYSDMKYNTGEYHENHKRDARKRTTRQREIMNSNAPVLAHVEDVFERAYPERKEHKTKVSVAKGGERAFAEMDDENESTVSLDSLASKTAAHELAHTLEGKFDVRQPYQQRIQEAATLTHLTRTGTASEVIYGNLNERALSDKYACTYTGKVYPNGATELVTTGVEEFFRYDDRGFDPVANKAVDLDPAKGQMKSIANFALTDPHHYLVAYGILKGYAK